MLQSVPYPTTVDITITDDYTSTTIDTTVW